MPEGLPRYFDHFHVAPPLRGSAGRLYEHQKKEEGIDASRDGKGVHQCRCGKIFINPNSTISADLTLGELLKDPDWIPYIGDPGFIGAYQVRHKLLEHYDPDQSPLEQGPAFSISSGDGPALQPGMSRDWTDKGLYVNAQELADVLERRVANALEKMGAATMTDPTAENSTGERGS